MAITIFATLITLAVLRVIELGDSNFTTTLSDVRLALIEFYAENCSTCSNFKTDFEKVEGNIDKKNYIVGRVDIEKNQMLYEKFNITETPTLYLLIQDKAYKYTDGYFNAINVTNWVLRLPSTTYKSINTAFGYNAFKQMKLTRSVVLKCFPNDSALEFYEELAKINTDFEFYWVDLKATNEKVRSLVIEVYNTKPSYTGEYTLSDISNFIELYRLPVISEYNKETEKALFIRHKAVVIFFISSEQYRKYFNEYYNCAKENFGKLIVTYYTGNNKQSVDISGITGVHETPSLLIYDSEGKYIYQGEITNENIRNFIQQYYDHELPLYYKSETITEPMYHKILTHIGRSNLQSFLNADGKKVLLVYSTIKMSCVNTVEDLERIAKKHPEVAYGIANTWKNNIYDMIEYSDVPTLIMYNGTTRVKTYTGAMNLQIILSFVKS